MKKKLVIFKITLNLEIKNYKHKKYNFTRDEVCAGIHRYKEDEIICGPSKRRSRHKELGIKFAR